MDFQRDDRFMEINMINQCAPLSEIAKGLEEDIKIVYSENGNRGMDVESALKKAKLASQKIGVTRLASIGEIVNSPIPVYTSARPFIFDHQAFGLNSGSQGKGNTHEQAQISCYIESIETYCIESHTTNFITGTFNSLAKKFLIANPQQFITRYLSKPPSLDECIPWVNTYCPLTKQEVLIPAELVHCMFYHDIYNISPTFPQSTTGLAGGLSYLEAIVHGLYEVIERAIWGEYQIGKSSCSHVFLSEDKFINPKYFEINKNTPFSIYKIESNIFKNFPFFCCVLESNGRHFIGHGCALDLKTALDRAISEAIQTMATVQNGTREDSTFKHWTKDESIQLQYKYITAPSPVGPFEKYPKENVQPPHTMYTTAELFERNTSPTFHTLGEEYNAIVIELENSGHPLFYVANLTRTGIDIPIVKVISPTLLNILDVYYQDYVSFEKVYRLRHRNMNFAKDIK
jgi:ribosomal protein S12 methylthiotransferase accessory factor